VKLSFPYMGETAVAYQKLATMFGHELVRPLKPTQRTIDLGVKYAPEFACFPLKVLLGSYLEAIEAGADTIVSTGGNGPCRAGYYGEVHKKTINNLGYDTKIIILDALYHNYKILFKDLNSIRGKTSLKQTFYVLKMIYKAIKAMDKVEKRICAMRPYEVKRGTVNIIWENMQKMIDDAFTIEAVKEAENITNADLDAVELIPVEEKDRLRIGIIGEIYVVMESSTNMRMEQKLADLGCEALRSQYLSDWIDFNIIPNIFSHPHEAIVKKMGQQFFKIPIGGHAQENMGWIAQYKEWGFDGVVHLFPFGCLPELMSQSIIPTISKDLDIPVISFPLDEQSGLANNMTRLEAFIDLIKAKKYGVASRKKGGAA
jgi:predicted nucleotide-binding protein (sugar kinase/HSP70/actin superfamily)